MRDPKFGCPKHGNNCDWNLTDHPLPSVPYQPLPPTKPIPRGSDDGALDVPDWMQTREDDRRSGKDYR